MPVVRKEDLVSAPDRYRRGVRRQRRRRGLRHPYLWGRDHPNVVDGVLAAFVCLIGLLTELANVDNPDLREPNAFSVALTIAGTLPLVARRRFPVGV